MSAGAGRDGFAPLRRPAGEPLRSVLTADQPGAEVVTEAAAQLDALVQDHFRPGLGALILTGLPADERSADLVSRRLAALIGTLVAQDREGTLVRMVADRGTTIGQGRRARYADSRAGGHLHTDGAELARPVPEVFTLFCVRPAMAGGLLQLLHIRDLLAALSPHPGAVADLRAPFHFDRRGDQPPGDAPTVVKPVIFDQDGRTAISYLRAYIDIGHGYPAVPELSQRQRAALDLVDEITADRRLLREGRLLPGQLGIFDNLSLLHGRTSFRDHPDRRQARLLLRTWIRRRPAGGLGRVGDSPAYIDWPGSLRLR